MAQSEQRSKVFSMFADDSDSNRMKVLIDGDGMKLLMDVWQEYVSDDDYVNFPDFMRKVDNLLLGFRGGKPLTKEERQEMNDAAPPKRRKSKKKKAVKPVETPNNSSTEVSASDINHKAITYFISRQLNKRAA